MSVEKLHPKFENGKLTHESNPYTQLSNHVLQNCTNIKALGIWCYLQSLPTGWIVSPKQLQNHFGIYKNGIYQLLKYLIDHNLITKNRITNEDGTVKEITYHVLNGSKFVINQEADPLLYFPEVDNPEVDNRDTINKIENIKKKEKHKEKRIAPQKVFLPDNYFYNDKHHEMALKFGLNIAFELEKFIDHYVGQKHIDWDARFRNWLRKSFEWKNKSQIQAKQKKESPFSDPSTQSTAFIGAEASLKRDREYHERMRKQELNEF